MDSPRELFSRHHMRCTRQRTILYDALRQCTSHPTADELFRMVQPRAAGLSRATVYNTLEALCQAGLARRMPTTNGCCRYDADTSDHLHLRIRETAEIRDVPAGLGARFMANLPASVIAEIEAVMGVKIDGVNIQLIGRSASTSGNSCAAQMV